MISAALVVRSVNVAWTLMSTHGVLLFYIAANPDSTMREIAHAVDVTERRVGQVIRELVEAGLVEIHREGRRNSYTVNHEARFRHPSLSHIPLYKFEELFAGHPPPQDAAAPHDAG